MAGSFLAEYDEVNTVRFGTRNQWWIKVRRYLARGDFKKAQAALVSPVMQSTGDAEMSTSGAIDSGGYQDELVVRAIVEWNLTDRSGVILPLEPEPDRRASVAQLPQSVFEAVLLKIEGATAAKDKKEEAAKEAEEAAFPGPGAEGAVGSGEPAEGAVLVSA